MYKIFINDKPFFLTKDATAFKANNGVFIFDFHKLKTLKSIFKLMELDTTKSVVVTGDVKEMWKEFLKHFKLIDAAGGVVKNMENKFLFIYRLGKWDLPKGKVDEGETLEQTAVREVGEECGITKLTITGNLLTTYHTYTLKGKAIVKASHWFKMTTKDTKLIKIQTEENITDACWASKAEIPSLLADAYPAIADVINDYFKK